MGLPVVDEEMFEQFRDIYEEAKRYSKKEDFEEHFRKGLQFAQLVFMKKDKKKAYEAVFGPYITGDGRDRTSDEATRFIMRRWVTQIIDRLQQAEGAVFLDKRLQVLQEAYESAMEEKGRNKLEAMRLFLEQTKKDKLEVEVTHSHEVAGELKEQLDTVLKQLSKSKQVILPSGEVIDAEVIHE